MSYGYDYSVAARAASSDRAMFIRRTYAHLAGAILAFMGIEALLLNVMSEATQVRVHNLMGQGWLLVMIAFIGAGWIARVWAHSDTSPAMQYMGLGLYVVAWSIIFLPLLIEATHLIDKTVIPTAGILTLSVFGGLTLSVFVTKKDYSFLRPILCVCSMIALGVIVASIFVGFGLGLVFSFAMVALASGYILYDTSNVMLHYRTDQHVGAALELFASVALLFWYILQIVMSFSSRD
ncbi:MAG TPA: Bax inhibitor-1 family protein [Gemmataceae bacterium]|nr:Bax inhibitor-1 family protein [Gemmataceae bacterium]